MASESSTSSGEIQDPASRSEDVSSIDAEIVAEHGEITVPKLIQTREELQNRLADHEAALKNTEIPLSTETGVETVFETIHELQNELRSLVTDFAQKEWILKRLQLNQTLMGVLFTPRAPTAGGDRAEQTSYETREEIKAMVLKQCDLVSQVLKAQNAMGEMRTQLDGTRKKNLEYLEENRKLMSQLKQRQEMQNNKAKKFAENAKIQDAREKVEKQLSKIELQRNTFQGLILGSGTNWAQDEQLTEVLLSLEHPLDL